MQIVSALFVENFEMRQAPGPSTRIDLTGAMFSMVAPTPVPVTIGPHFVGLIFCPPDRRYFVGAQGDVRGNHDTRDRAQVSATDKAMAFYRAAIIRVGKKIGKAEQSDERHEDAHRDLQPDRTLFPHSVTGRLAEGIGPSP